MDEEREQINFLKKKYGVVPIGALVKVCFPAECEYKSNIEINRITDLVYFWEVLNKIERQFCLNHATEEISYKRTLVSNNIYGLYLGSLNASYHQGNMKVYRAILIKEKIYIVPEEYVYLARSVNV